jgi:hypothetical protein
VIGEALTRQQGLTQLQLQQYADTVTDISATSIGNELRRNEGTMYQREGHRWYLIEQESKGAPEEAPPSHEVSHHAA